MKNNNFLFALLLIAVGLFTGNSVSAQYYQSMGIQPGNPVALNQDSDIYFATEAPPAGSTILYTYNWAKDYTLKYTAVQTIPFTFDFNGSPVTQYKVSTSGYVTFTTSGATPVGATNTALPNASLPDKTICIWGFVGAAGGGKIYTKVYGTSPNRQLWIGFWFAGNPLDTNSQNMWDIVLEETTNNIYLADEWGNVVYSNARPYIPINLTLGVQVNATTAYQVTGSPKANAHTWSPGYTDNIYYEFSPSKGTAYTPQVKFPLLEEFMQASCGPCFEAAPNIDSVLTNSKAICNPVRYHVDWPGVDYMNNETQDSVETARVAYYAIQGVPDAKLDGASDVYPGGGYFTSLSTNMISDERFIGSPFQLTLKDSFDVATETYYATGTIKAVHAFDAGLVAQAILTVDTVKYSFDQSTEDPNNNSPFLLDFPQVVEAMFPSTDGTTLSAFTVGQSQTVQLSWKKPHAWGAYVTNNNCYCYDSTNTHITFFVQDNSDNYVYQSVAAAPGQTVSTPYTPPVSTSVSNTQRQAIDIALYPNPTGNYTNIAFALDEQTTTTIDIYNMVGQQVYHSEKGMLTAGQHVILLNTTALQSGIYMVKVTTDNTSQVNKLVIQK